MSISPPRWTEEQFIEDAERSAALFKYERLQEPLERWKAAFDFYEKQFRQLFDEYGIANPALLTPEKIGEVFQGQLGDAVRYLAGPPISEDDLKVLADASLAPSKVAADPAAAKRIIDTVLLALDTCRFPWLAENRLPTETEKRAAIVASAALITAQRVATDRRNEGRHSQESGVKEYLNSVGFSEVAPRDIRTFFDAPAAGTYCGESKVGSRKADIVVRLFDNRIMPIECKVSNSYTNSVKRLNNDAQVKATVWKREMGINQIVPAAVLSGLFKVHNLVQAQEHDLTIFWAHHLDRLGSFIQSTK